MSINYEYSSHIKESQDVENMYQFGFKRKCKIEMYDAWRNLEEKQKLYDAQKSSHIKNILKLYLMVVPWGVSWGGFGGRGPRGH